METIILILFFLSSFFIFWAMIGYPLSLKVLKKIFRNRKLKKDYTYEPSVTVMIVAHNEEKVIREKMFNVTNLDYPKDKIKILVASDNSTDNTNKLVREFMKNNPEFNVRLYEVRERKGKTNAQNEAQKTVDSEILVMTDANSILERNSIKELVSTFATEDVAYVCGRLIFINSDVSDVAHSENTYWERDLSLRKIESNIQTITAGNGALYACRNSEYHDFTPIKSHDSNMPRYFALNNKKALFNPDAIVYEKAGEVVEDEFKRKVRMSRGILWNILPDLRILNIFKYRWYSYFYFGHRSCRYLLWISHLIIFVANGLLITKGYFYLIVFLAQVLFYSLAFVQLVAKTNNKYLSLIYYYCMTILAQWIGVYNIVTGRAKPFWDKAKSTR